MGFVLLFFVFTKRVAALDSDISSINQKLDTLYSEIYKVNSEEVVFEIQNSQSVKININGNNIPLATSSIVSNISTTTIWESGDIDGDGLLNGEELRYKTNLQNPDTDGDGYNDLLEIQNGYNPLGNGELKKKIDEKENNKETDIDNIEVMDQEGYSELNLNNATKSQETASTTEVSIFEKIKQGTKNIYSGVSNFVKEKIFKQNTITFDNIREFLSMTDEEYIDFVKIAKNQQEKINKDIKSAETKIRARLLKMLGDKFTLSTKNFAWPVSKDTIIYTFHDENYPFKNIINHPGIDIRAKQGTPVVAANSGYVAKVQDGEESGYSYVLLVHGSGLSTVYGHLSRIDVEEGKRIIRGQQIGLSGGEPGTNGAGNLTTGPHLHFEVRVDGDPVNPIIYLD